MDKAVLPRIYFMKIHLVVHLLTETLQYTLHKRTQVSRGMKVKIGCASQQPHGRDETGQSKTVVTMTVTDEDMPQACHAQAYPAPLHLSPLTAIYHVEFATQVENLTRRQVSVGRFGTSTAEDMKSEGFHGHVMRRV